MRQKGKSTFETFTASSFQLLNYKVISNLSGKCTNLARWALLAE
jgi:hypothetical protein